MKFDSTTNILFIQSIPTFANNSLFPVILGVTIFELFKRKKGYISKMVNSRNRINEKIIFLHVSNTEEICDLMHSFLD